MQKWFKTFDRDNADGETQTIIVRVGTMAGRVALVIDFATKPLQFHSLVRLFDSFKAAFVALDDMTCAKAFETIDNALAREPQDRAKRAAAMEGLLRILTGVPREDTN